MHQEQDTPQPIARTDEDATIPPRSRPDGSTRTIDSQTRKIADNVTRSAPTIQHEKSIFSRGMTELKRMTGQLPATTPAAPSRQVVAQAASAAQRERLQTLIAALSDTSHPIHQRAVDELVAIGSPAVPQLCEMLGPNRPWLTAYRSAEALGRIGDGRAAGPLLDALNHPNSNVRWSAVRALANVGDARALLELRRVARSDQGKTSWGESVSGAAQSVLEQLQSQNVLMRGAELIKTAFACVFMLVALILAWSFVSALREEFTAIGQIASQPQTSSTIVRTAVPTVPRGTPLPDNGQAAAGAAGDATPIPEQTPVPILARVIAGGNVRAQPVILRNNIVGAVREGDQLIILGKTADKEWYHVRLGENVSAQSRITSADRSGWVSQSLLGTVEGNVPVEDVQPAASATPALTPTP